MKKAISPPEREAANVQRSLALRFENYSFDGAEAILAATPRLEDGELVLSYPDSLKAQRAIAHRLSLAMRHYTDHPVRVERVRGA